MSERLPYEPMDQRQRAIDMVHALKVTKDGDTFDLIARLLRDSDKWREAERCHARWVLCSREIVEQMRGTWSERAFHVRMTKDDGAVIELEFQDAMCAGRETTENT